MENWGLVTYREVALLCDEKTVSATQKQRICTVITHELAHQWFGNLVTMAWWDDLWLNEGFANWMQTFAADSLHPEWNIWESYVGMEQQQALKLDSLRSSHPIQVPIGRAQEVEEVFDAISYCKGGSTVRMIYAVLGKEKFQEGLKLYFQRHQYGNTETHHLWQAWADASGKPLPDMMNSWTTKMGFPVLKVLADPFASGSFKADCEQSWFLADGSVLPGDEEKTWYLPVLIGGKNGAMEMQIVREKKGTLNFAKDATWAKLNFGQHVPMRVLYPSSMVERLAANMASVPAEDRIGLLSDAFALCKAGMQEPEQLIQLLSGFKGERNDKVWAELTASLSGLDGILRQTLDAPARKLWETFAEQLTVPAFLEVGWDTRGGDDDNTKKLRSTMAALMAKFCSAGADHMKAAGQKCEAFLAADTKDCNTVLSADVRAAVLTCAMKSNPCAELFDKLVANHNRTDDGTVRQHIYSAVGDAPDKALREKALAWALSDDVRAQDLIYLPMFVTRSGSEGAEECFQWIQLNYDTLYARLGATSMMLFQHFVRISGAGFVTEEKAQEVQKFWDSKSVKDKIGKCLQQTVELIKTNAQFAKRVKASKLSDPEFWKANMPK
jgi:aminopeptidase N